MLSSSLAPPPSISCPRSMDLCRKPSPVPEMHSRSQKRASGTMYRITRLDPGIRMISVSFSCGLLGALTRTVVILFSAFVFHLCKGGMLRPPGSSLGTRRYDGAWVSVHCLCFYHWRVQSCPWSCGRVGPKMSQHLLSCTQDLTSVDLWSFRFSCSVLAETMDRAASSSA